MSETDLKQYLQRLQLDKAILNEASKIGASDFILLLGITDLAISTTKRLLLKYSKNLLDEN